MYAVTVLLLLFVLPVASIVVAQLGEHPASLMMDIGRWFVFWGAGIRLVLAGLRQFFQPQFTAREIFDIQGTEALVIVRELGVANFATGAVGVLQLFIPTFTLPIAIVAAIFYGIAGLRHLVGGCTTMNQRIAMISDCYIFLILASFLAFRVR